MGFKQGVNRALESSLGVRIHRAHVPIGPGRSYRLVPSPIFVFSSIRSGSTLLRVILNSHSQICAPHEMHLRSLKVQFGGRAAQRAFDAVGLRSRDLEHLLWDRVLAALLAESGKKHIASKTPGDTLAWRRISQNWPRARYIFLLRHPASIAESWHEAHPERSLDEIVAQTRSTMDAVEEARTTLRGHTVRYEDLLEHPHDTLRDLCRHLRVPFEPTMLDYGEQDHGKFTAGLGDWRSKIKSGRLQEARPLPTAEEIPPALLDLVEAWGYNR